MKANRVVTLVIVALLLFTSLACNIDDTSDATSISTPTPVADSIVGCHDRVYAECMANGNAADTCKEMVKLTCED